jgi:hypothetical protein
MDQRTGKLPVAVGLQFSIRGAGALRVKPVGGRTRVGIVQSRAGFFISLLTLNLRREGLKMLPRRRRHTAPALPVLIGYLLERRRRS